MPKRPENIQRPWVVKRDNKGNNITTKGHDNHNSMASFYNNKRWKNIRAYFIKRNPLCIECERGGLIKGAEVIDHIIPIKQGGDMYSEKNLQPMCKKCHDKKSRRERDTIVYNKGTMRP
tara:strand:- start:15 stop:371 length:357 start_codon:yes stop_codon:yes gene_type:complete